MEEVPPGNHGNRWPLLYPDSPTPPSAVRGSWVKPRSGEEGSWPETQEGPLALIATVLSLGCYRHGAILGRSVCVPGRPFPCAVVGRRRTGPPLPSPLLKRPLRHRGDLRLGEACGVTLLGSGSVRSAHWTLALSPGASQGSTGSRGWVLDSGSRVPRGRALSEGSLFLQAGGRELPLPTAAGGHRRK